MYPQTPNPHLHNYTPKHLPPTYMYPPNTYPHLHVPHTQVRRTCYWLWQEEVSNVTSIWGCHSKLPEEEGKPPLHPPLREMAGVWAACIHGLVQGIVAEKKEARAEKDEAEKYKKLQEDYVRHQYNYSHPTFSRNRSFLIEIVLPSIW